MGLGKALNLNLIAYFCLKYSDLKKHYFLICLCSLLFAGCGWFKETPEIGLVLAKRFNNKLYNAFDTATYHQVFLKQLDAAQAQLDNPNTLRQFYRQHQLNPEFVTHHYVNGDLDTLISYLSRSQEHGFSPELFGLKRLIALKSTLDAHQFNTLAEAYPAIADLEINAAAALLKYHSLVYFGSLNPRKLLNRYYIGVKRPDSVGMIKALETKNMAALLENIQPASAQYKAFQKELSKYSLSDTSKGKLKLILVNMERLRWKLPDAGTEYVEVNIPDFALTWFQNGDTLTRMKVCVGAGKDSIKNHETPILFSKLNAVQVNPVWNIPVSIAQNEIYNQASGDPFYLSNNNMRVYYKGKLVVDPDTIQWSHYSKSNLPFQFKQGSGAGNALGKFKFIFDNGSSIYLHDTNNKSAFNKSNRAISHGCVRVEKPLEFAQLLVNNKNQFDQLRMEVNLPPLDTTKMGLYRKKLAKKVDTNTVFVLKPSWFEPKKPIPLFINYVTAWWQNGVLQVRPDVYGLDEILWMKLKKFI